MGFQIRPRTLTLQRHLGADLMSLFENLTQRGRSFISMKINWFIPFNKSKNVIFNMARIHLGFLLPSHSLLMNSVIRYNQIMASLAADQLIFNSKWNLDSFLGNMNSHLKIIPDFRHGFKTALVKWGASFGWSSCIYCPFRNSDQMTIGKTHLTLFNPMIFLTYAA